MIPTCGRASLFVALWLLLTVGFVQGQGNAITEDMRQDVAALVAAAKRLDTAWPWQGPLPEIDVVAKHGKRVAPLLVALLRYGSDKDYGDGVWDLHVEQQVELALCKIYGVTPESERTVYGIRSSEEANKKIKRFWQATIRRQK